MGKTIGQTIGNNDCLR